MTRNRRATTVLAKLVMGATGLVWVVFVIGHVLGNLLVFRGRAAMNAYSVALHASPELLWIVRAVLYGSLVLHIGAAIWLTRVDLAARPVGYAKKVPRAATVASRSIRWTGAAILAFFVFHILHLTTGTIHPERFDESDIFGNVVRSFQIGWVAAVYIAAMIAIGLHVFHGTWASFKSLGQARLGVHPFRRRVALVVGVGVWLGFTLIPLAIASGVIG